MYQRARVALSRNTAVLHTRSDFPGFVGRFWVHILLYLKSLWRVLFPSSFAEESKAILE